MKIKRSIKRKIYHLCMNIKLVLDNFKNFKVKEDLFHKQYQN